GRVRDGHGPVDRARAARRRARPDLGGELHGRRGAVHDRDSGRTKRRERARARGRSHMTGPARILLVDDEPSIQRALTPLLRSRGYDVEVAGTGRDALRIATEHPPDLIVLDLGLPDIEGTEVCRRVRQSSALPIIILSARGREADKVAALDL